MGTNCFMFTWNELRHGVLVLKKLLRLFLVPAESELNINSSVQFLTFGVCTVVSRV